MNHVDKVRAPKPGSVQAFDARCFPTPDGDEVGRLVLLTILVERIEGTVKAYSAIVPDTSRQDPQYREPAQWVRKNGNPLTFKDARAIWPGITPEEYAR